MREILFKAKARKTNRWTQGKDLMQGLPFGELDGIDINPETICQFIGENDRNEKKIFINDTVQICVFFVSPENPDDDHHFRGRIDFINGCIVFVFEQYLGVDGWRKMISTDPFGYIFEHFWDDDQEWYLPLWEVMGTSSNLGYFEPENIEVIGNIHENEGK